MRIHNKVILYSTPSCVYCRMAKKFFEEHGVPYEEYDVSTDGQAREEMAHRSHQLGVPVIEVNGEVFVGFDKVLIKRALGIH
ncbi:MAG: glutaredoxin family protein [bacterium]|nr:glutaredoxin family protein [bacterium]